MTACKSLRIFFTNKFTFALIVKQLSKIISVYLILFDQIIKEFVVMTYLLKYGNRFDLFYTSKDDLVDRFDLWAK